MSEGVRFNGGMKELLRQIASHMDAHQWSYTHDTEEGVILSNFNGENAGWQFVVLADESENSVSVVSVLPSLVKPERRAAVAELVARINHRVCHGAFQLDMDKGRIRFVTSLFVPSAEVQEEQLNMALFVNMGTMDRWYDALMKVIHGGQSPKTALAEKPKVSMTPHNGRFQLN